MVDLSIVTLVYQRVSHWYTHILCPAMVGSHLAGPLCWECPWECPAWWYLRLGYLGWKTWESWETDGDLFIYDTRPGKLTVCYGKWPFIVDFPIKNGDFPGKRLHNYGKSPFWMGKLTISMAIFNSYVSHYQRVVGMKFYDWISHWSIIIPWWFW